MTGLQLMVIAKAPVPGRVKTRLCPPCTPDQAAQLAECALADTLDAASRTAASRRVLLLEGDYPAPPGWDVIAQRGEGLDARLAAGFASVGDAPTLLIGMDTPQVTAELLTTVADGLSTSDGVLCPAEDGGWWALALRSPQAGRALLGVPMSQSNTGDLTLAALGATGLDIATGPTLRDVDLAADAQAVAELCPGSRFARAVAEVMA